MTQCELSLIVSANNLASSRSSFAGGISAHACLNEGYQHKHEHALCNNCQPDTSAFIPGHAKFPHWSSFLVLAWYCSKKIWFCRASQATVCAGRSKWTGTFSETKKSTQVISDHHNNNVQIPGCGLPASSRESVDDASTCMIYCWRASM